jgi:hypothetical protein
MYWLFCTQWEACKSDTSKPIEQYDDDMLDHDRIGHNLSKVMHTIVKICVLRKFSV